MPDTVVPPNLRLIGGEMLAWSDPRPARGRVLAHFARAACPPDGRVLVAGPHERGLIEDLASAGAGGGAAVTCLLRSYADSATLAEHLPGVQVLCGSLAKLGPDEQFDVIVALDGLHRLTSVEGLNLSWGEALDALLGALRPGGRLLFTLENLLGVHELVRMTPWYADESDEAWTPAGEYDETRPRSLDQLTDRLATAGAPVAATYFGYPLPDAPGLLVRRAQRTGEAAQAGRLDGIVAAACAEGFAGTPVLTDPRQLATSALRAGLGHQLAPLWLVVADRGAAASPPPDVPEILVTDAGPRAVAYEITADWTRRPLGDRPTELAAGPVRREPDRLAGPLPAGRPLEQELLGACLRRDVPAVRRMLGDYARWLAEHRDDQGRLPGDAAFATPAQTAVDGPVFAPLDPSWRLAEPIPYDVALARGLRQFAVTLLTGGYSHPWPTTTDADGLTVILAGMAGHEVTHETVRRAVEVEVEITAAVRGYDEPERAAYAQWLATVEAGTPALDVSSHRKLQQAVLRLRQELEHARSKLAWNEELLAKREQALKRAERTISLFSGSMSYRAGRMLVGLARKGVGGARRVARAAKRAGR
jgi:SAM-dependent methyltransferase